MGGILRENRIHIPLIALLRPLLGQHEPLAFSFWSRTKEQWQFTGAGWFNCAMQDRSHAKVLRFYLEAALQQLGPSEYQPPITVKRSRSTVQRQCNWYVVAPPHAIYDIV